MPLVPQIQLTETPLVSATKSVSPVLLEALAQYPALMDSVVHDYFPPGEMDPDGQQVDRRPGNSWSLRQHEIGTLELLETHLVNAVAPFILCRRLKPLLLRSPFARRFIVNVSAMEGQFGRNTKTALHPHTNMAKAALNMLTRTSAADFAKDGIFMNSVDTGWITDEKPLDRREQYQEQVGFHTPLDVLDGMARIYDPIARGMSEPEEPLYGHFLKDYQPYPW
jgi:NAD(P)-dependent dehydrogenase (short-subunit alcohol dehydrogenase family)